MTKTIDTKSDPSVRVLTDVEVVHVAGAAGVGLAVPLPQISKTLLAAIERFKSELHVAMPRV